ncbi:RNA-binding protein [Candidatus Woesearchaeota archaeon]|nr:RNA-binding protein [Candidatus Woesearchaeota archaeon]
MKQCMSCRKSIMNDRGSVFFKCPKCLKEDIVRCSSCRKNAVKFTCPQCEFTGPN